MQLKALKKIIINKKLVYILILASILLGYLFSNFNINVNQDYNLILMPLLLTLPVFFSGLAFSNEILIHKNFQNDNRSTNHINSNEYSL